MPDSATAQHGGPRPGAGRKPQLTAPEQARYAHWRAWWAARLDQMPSAYALAKRMEQPGSTVRAAANGDRPPNATLLTNLESLCAAYGYEPLTSDHQFL